MKAQLDEIDKLIMEHLHEDVRRSNRKIAQSLGLAEGTVRTRILRMREQGLVRFTAALDSKIYEQPVNGFIGVNTSIAYVRQVAAELTGFSELNFVATVLGRYDILCTYLVADAEQLRSLLQDKIPAIEGVKNAESVQDLRRFKFDRRWSVLNTSGE